MRTDRFFTLWIFVWICFYLFQILSFNPTIFLFAANVVHIAFLISLETNYDLEIKTRIELYGITTFFILLQLIISYRLTYEDALFGYVLFVMYLFYILLVYKKRFADIYIDLYNDLKNNRRVLVP